MLALVALSMLLTMVAMGVDLAFGWRKAKERGDAHTSYAFSRTINKFILYEGSIIVAACVDVMLHFSLPELSLMSSYNVPFAAFFVAIVLCCTEIWSMREKADEKTRNRVNQAATMLVKSIGKEELARILAASVKRQNDEAQDLPQ